MARIALLLPDLFVGGAERVTLTLAACLAALGDEVDLVVLRREGPLVDEVPTGVRLVSLDALRFRQAVAPLARYCAREKPDVLLAPMWPLSSIAIWAARRSGTRVVVAEHNMLSVEARTWSWGPRILLRPILGWTHRRAAARIAVSRGAADDLARLCRLPAGAVEAIHNPIPLPALPEMHDMPDWRGTGRRILTVGTLKAQKNHRLLIQAFAHMSRPEDRLAIVGEGDERDALRRAAAALGIGDRLLLPGFTSDPARWYASADLFVLSSDFEGFANVVAEALGHGLTVVSTDCPSGPAEILAGLGRLVPVGDADALATAITSALDHPDNPAAARERAQAFAPASIARHYRTVLLGKTE